MSYMESYDEIIPIYTGYISDTEALISELEVIHQEVQKIVETAKARYIRQRAAVGDPVDIACIDAAYVINKGDFAKATRRERGAIETNPKIREMNNARSHFEAVALIKPEIVRSTRENPRNTCLDQSRYNYEGVDTYDREYTDNCQPRDPRDPDEPRGRD